MNEVNYTACDEVSIEYHIELFNELHRRLRKSKLAGNRISSVDEWLSRNTNAILTKGDSPDCQHYNCYSGYVDKTMTVYIRNYFDHPGDDPNLEGSGKGRTKPKIEEIQDSIEFITNLFDTVLVND